MFQFNPLGAREESSRGSTVFAVPRTRVIAAALLLFAGYGAMLSSAPSAYAEETKLSPAECAAKCDADEKQCLDNQSSEELCDYDKKMCKKACAQQ